MLEMDAIDRKLLDAIQAGIPLVERPYCALGEGVGLAEGDVIGRVAKLKAEGRSEERRVGKECRL